MLFRSIVDEMDRLLRALLDDVEKLEADPHAYPSVPRYRTGRPIIDGPAMLGNVYDPETGETTVRQMSDDPVVCECFGVHESEIVGIAKENNLTTAEEVMNFCKAGGACGNCVSEIREILGRIRETRRDEKPAAERPMTQLQKIRKIEEIVEREIRPVLKRDGGDLDLVDVRGDEVLIAFRGICAGCASAQITRVSLVQAKLREFVSPAITVGEA